MSVLKLTKSTFFFPIRHTSILRKASTVVIIFIVPMPLHYQFLCLYMYMRVYVRLFMLHSLKAYSGFNTAISYLTPHILVIQEASCRFV